MLSRTQKDRFGPARTYFAGRTLEVDQIAGGRTPALSAR
jgi:hypothetical protein